jgi:hypothetical protein
MHGNSLTSLTQKVRAQTSNPAAHALCGVAELLQHAIASYQVNIGCPNCRKAYAKDKARALEFKHRAKREVKASK